MARVLANSCRFTHSADTEHLFLSLFLVSPTFWNKNEAAVINDAMINCVVFSGVVSADVHNCRGVLLFLLVSSF